MLKPEIEVRLNQEVISAHKLDYREGHYFDLITGENKDHVAAEYSRMKFGSVVDTLSLARDLADAYIAKLNEPGNQLVDLFKQISRQGENIVIFAPAFRNVGSASNRLIDVAAKLINIELASRGLPTIIVVKLPRMRSAPSNYATLSADERKQVCTGPNIIGPGEELFRVRTHAIFGDDVKITGSTANDAREKSLSAGAQSFSEIYALTINPDTALMIPEIEDALNQFQVKGLLDEEISSILNQPGFQPVQRLLRLMLKKENLSRLPHFLADPKLTPDGALVKLYLSSLSNDYTKDNRYSPSVEILIEATKIRGLIDSFGQPYDLSLL